jgi:hypothetical protein
MLHLGVESANVAGGPEEWNVVAGEVAGLLQVAAQVLVIDMSPGKQKVDEEKVLMM